MKKIIIRTLQFAALALLLWLGFHVNLLVYGLQQLSGQLKLIWNAEPVEQYIQNHPDSTANIQKLEYLAQVRVFAMDSLGLHSSPNYTTFYDHGKQNVMWVVTGCRPFAMEAKEWSFPFLGDLSYKGFFREELAKQEASEIRTAGYEADIYNPTAWSTLGFMNDPILSGMLNRGPGQLAELIIHELTHATVYLPDEVDYNENLATFIGEQGAILFLAAHFGSASAEKQRYERMLHDQEVYSRHMLHGAEQLDSLYQTFSADTDLHFKYRMKYRLIAQIMLGINQLPLLEPERYRFDFRKEPLPGNPFFMSYRRYRKDQSELLTMLHEKYGGNLREMIRGLSNP